METIIDFGQYALSFLIVLSVLVFVHEFGHYWVAKKAGVWIESFSIGFGRELFGWHDKAGTRWKFSLIPLGGYVKMFGDADPASKPDAEIEGMSRKEREVALYFQPLWKRALIVAAGPLANFLFSLVALSALFMTIGEIVTPPQLGTVMPDSPAAEAGLEKGDLILDVDGESIEDFGELSQLVRVNTGTEMNIRVRRGEREFTVTATPQVETQRMLRRQSQIGVLGIAPPMEPQVSQVVADSAAAEAGFKPGDRILTMDGREVESFVQLRDYVRARPGEPIRFEIRRGEAPHPDIDPPGESKEAAGPRTLTLTATPTPREIETAGGETETFGQIGIYPARNARFTRYGPIRAIDRGADQTLGFVNLAVTSIRQLVTGRRSLEELGGPIHIAEASGRMAERGLYSLVMFMAFLSVNLGLINLVPIPILDGGHLLLYAIEGVRGKPLSLKAQEVAFTIGLIFIGALMLLIFSNDILHLPSPQCIGISPGEECQTLGEFGRELFS